MPRKLTRRQKTNVRFLHEKVFPHMEGMPTVESYEEQDNPADSIAYLDLDSWTSQYRANGNKITCAYDCGKSGCVAGWYVMMSDEKRRFDRTKDKPKFDMMDLGDHFGFSTFEADLLFEGKGQGSERLDYGDDCDIDTHETIRNRKEFLECLMMQYGLRPKHVVAV